MLSRSRSRLRKLRLFSIVLALTLVSPVPISIADDGYDGVLALRYDLDSASTIYCKVDGPAKGIGKIKTTGSSQNVTENTAGENPFRAMSVGYVIGVDTTPSAPPAAQDLAYVITVTDDSNIVVNPPVDWSTGYPWKYWTQACGTTLTDGWIDMSGLSDGMVCVQIKQMNATAVEWRVEGKMNGVDAQPNVIYPGQTSDCGPNGTLNAGFCRFTSTSDFAGNHCLYIPEREAMVRVGMKIDTDDGGDLTTNAEQITIKVTGRIRR